MKENIFLGARQTMNVKFICGKFNFVPIIFQRQVNMEGLTTCNFRPEMTLSGLHVVPNAKIYNFTLTFMSWLNFFFNCN